MVTPVMQEETKTELWHQCSVAEPKRWALWDEEGGLQTWRAVIGTKNSRTSTYIWISCVFFVSRFVHGFQPSLSHKVRDHSPCRTQHPKP